MRAKDFAIYQCRIVLVDLCDMRFYIVFPLLHYSEIYHAARQCSAFDENPLAIRHPGESYAAVSDLLYFDALEQFHHAGMIKN
jgi:hypothetical protein